MYAVCLEGDEDGAGFPRPVLIMAIVGVFGKPGAGKTTYLASIVAKNERKKKICGYIPFLKYIPFIRPYSVIYCNDESVYGAVYYEPSSLGHWKPAKNSCILMSEAGVYWNNRNTMKCDPAAHRLWAIHRHLHCDIFWESQCVDVDIKLRQRTDHIWLLKKALFFRNNSVLQRVAFSIDVNDEQHVIAEMYSVPKTFLGKLLSKLTGGRKILRRKKFYKWFNSWSEDDFEYKLNDPAEIRA